MARTATKSKGAMAGQLRLEIEQARVKADAPRPAPRPPEPSPGPMIEAVDGDAVPATPFGAWLVKQSGRSEMIDALARAAKADPRFPKQGTPDEVRHHIGAKGADPDIFEAIDDAESEWLRA